MNKINLEIESFDPKKAELNKIIKPLKGLKIKDTNDKKGFDEVHTGQMQLRDLRVKIEKKGLEARRKIKAFSDNVLKDERELTGIIKPVEKKLKAEKDRIIEEKERERRKELLPNRIKKLKEYDVDVKDCDLLYMDDKQFDEFLVKKRNEYLAEKEREMKEEQEKIEAEKRKLEEEKRIEEEKKKARIEAEKQAKIKASEEKKEAEKEKQRAIEAERQRAEEEKQRLIAKQKRKEQERVEAEKRKKEQEEAEKKEKERKEAEEQAKKEFKEFLEKHGVNAKNRNEFLIRNEDGKTNLYRFIARYER